MLTVCFIKDHARSGDWSFLFDHCWQNYYNYTIVVNISEERVLSLKYLKLLIATEFFRMSLFINFFAKILITFNNEIWPIKMATFGQIIKPLLMLLSILEKEA